MAATKACIAPLDNPFHEARAYAMMHLAAVAAAAYYVLAPTIQKLPAELLKDGCKESGVAIAEAAYVLTLAVIPDGPAKAQGIALGKAAAAATLAKRAITPMRVRS